MPRPIPQVPCDMVRNCPRAWLVIEAKGRGGLVIEAKRTCRQHATVAINHMLTLSAKVEVRIAR